MNNKVFVVFDEDDPYCGHGILRGVFTNKEEAESFCSSTPITKTTYYVTVNLNEVDNILEGE